MNQDLPVGAIAAYGGPTAGPFLQKLHELGWLLCDGATYEAKAAEYAELFAVLGNSYGGSSGEGKFAVPDLRGRFIRGRDDGNAERDPEAPRKLGSQQAWATGLPTGNSKLTTDTAWADHTHAMPGMPAHDEENAAAIGGFHAQEWSSDIQETSSGGQHGHKVVGGGDAETRPPNIYVYYMIKFRSEKSVEGEV